jgi:UDP-glucose 4-epimerase
MSDPQKKKHMKMLVTGGAGFIGSYLVEALIHRGEVVRVLDDLSSGSKRNLRRVSDLPNLDFVRGDCRNANIVRTLLEKVDTVFHLAANPEIRIELANPKECFEGNIKATFALLEQIKTSKADTIVFASSSTVYGDARQIPTPEDYGPLLPISVYGASKLACEAMISSYCSSFNKKGIILRLANILGPRSQHGVVFDFRKKLKKNPNKLQILGDGKQSKSYLHVDDCINAILKASDSPIEGNTAIYNIGSADMITVEEIAKIVAKEQGLKDVKFEYTGGVDGGRGWIGDVKTMLLDTRKIKALNWKPKLNSKQAVQKLVHELKPLDN